MFTGIVSSIGAIAEAEPNRLVLSAPEAAPKLQPGASVAVNGCCLTVTAVAADRVHCDVVPETLRRTNLGGLRPGSPVNLELPLTLSTPLDGHLVQGHVDVSSRITQIAPVQSGLEMSIELPPELERFVAEKGSIAVDGVSLTVASVSKGAFGVALIPHTLQATIASAYQVGTLVNLEVDLLARYANRLLAEPIK